MSYDNQSSKFDGHRAVAITIDQFNEMEFENKVVADEFQQVYPLVNYRLTPRQMEILDDHIRSSNEEIAYHHGWVHGWSNNINLRLWRKGFFKKMRQNCPAYKLTMDGYKMYLWQSGQERHIIFDRELNEEGRLNGALK